jgi:hypothetical protein
VGDRLRVPGQFAVNSTKITLEGVSSLLVIGMRRQPRDRLANSRRDGLRRQQTVSDDIQHGFVDARHDHAEAPGTLNPARPLPSAYVVQPQSLTAPAALA